MGSLKPIGSVAECYAEALMIEREAAERCAEFATFLEDHGELSAAAVFRKLARYEQGHAEELARRADNVALPTMRQADFSWLFDAAPDQASHGLIFHLMTPYDALKIALEAERRAKVLFERIAASTDNPEVRSLAEELANDEDEHLGWLQEALDRMPHAPVSEADFERMLERH